MLFDDPASFPVDARQRLPLLDPPVRFVADKGQEILHLLHRSTVPKSSCQGTGRLRGRVGAAAHCGSAQAHVLWSACGSRPRLDVAERGGSCGVGGEERLD